MDFRIFDNDEEDGQLSFFNMDNDMFASEDDYEVDAESPSAAKESVSEKKAESERDEDEESATASHEKKSAESAPAASAPLSSAIIPSTGAARISRCQCCGKMLFVREEADGFHAHCNNCEVSYQIRA